MFESHYLRPFLMALFISILMITGMGLSLKGMGGTGAGQEAAEISFDLADVGESEHADEHSVVTPPQVPKPSEDTAATEVIKPQKPQAKPQLEGLDSTKKTDDPQKEKNTKREWAVPKAIESEASGGEMGVIAHQNSSSSKKLVGNTTSTDPNAQGNGIDDTNKDLSFFVDALQLLTPGQRAWLEQPEINPTEYLRQVREQGKASSVRGEAVVRVNFDADGNVIVGVNTPRIVESGVPPDVRDEALRIIKTSGSIVNKKGQVVALAIPVVLGQ